MSTTLSQRLRDLREHLPTFGAMDGSVWIPLDDAIAQAEAMEKLSYFEARVKPSSDDPEAQAGELSDEVIDRIGEDYAVKSYTYGIFSVSDRVPYVIGVKAGIRYARDHYLRPSQAIGEQTPVAWMTEDTGDIVKDKELKNMGGNWKAVYSIPLYRSPISPEARDRAIEGLEKLRADCKQAYDEGKVVDWLAQRTMILTDQALSALRGQTPGA